MAFSAAAETGDLARSFSVGPVKFEIQTFSCVSTDTSGTITANALSRIDEAVLLSSGPLCQTSAPSISGTTVTLAMADPASGATGYVAKNVHGLVLLIGR